MNSSSTGGRDQSRPTSSLQGRLGPASSGGSYRSGGVGGDRREDRGARGGPVGPGSGGGAGGRGGGASPVDGGRPGASPPAPPAEPADASEPSEALMNKIKGFVAEFVSEKDKKEALQVCFFRLGVGGWGGLMKLHAVVVLSLWRGGMNRGELRNFDHMLRKV